MTALALNYSQKLWHLIEVVFNGLKKTLQGMMVGYILARQNQANFDLARRMLHEYPEHTLASLHAELNRKTLDSIKSHYND
jgi:hypothetical protein